jgi:hypothetical protein
MHRFPSVLLLALVVSIDLSVILSRCSAQPLGKSVLVAYGSADLEQAFAALPDVEAELAQRRVSLISMHDARDRFELSSRAPQVASELDLDALAKEAREAVQHVAFGRTAAAQRSVQHIISLAERSLESLNRETTTARQLLDACLALVRASAHDGNRDRAIEEAMRCRRLVPDLSPNEASHPANVIGVLAEADDQLRRMRVGSLRVHNRPERTCAVYLNGRHLGTTPFALDRAAVGEYRVQVECDENNPGRVHVVQLGDKPVELTVDTAFDAAIVTEPRLALHYLSEPAARTVLVEHAVQLGREVGAEDVVLLSTHPGQVELLRVQVRQQRLVAGTTVSLAANRALDREALSQALDRLAQGRFAGVRPADYGPGPPGDASRLVALYTVHTKPADARLVLDGAVAARGAGETLPLRFGSHVLEVRADGYRGTVRDLVVNDATPRRMDVVLEPLERAVPSEAKPLRRKWWFWTTLGAVVAAGVTTGLVLGLRDKEKASSEPTIDVMQGKLRL